MDQERSPWEIFRGYVCKFEILRLVTTAALAIINELFMGEMLVRICCIAGVAVIVIMIVQKKKAEGSDEAPQITHRHLSYLWAIITVVPFAVLGLVHLGVLSRSDLNHALGLVRKVLRILR